MGTVRKRMGAGGEGVGGRARGRSEVKGDLEQIVSQSR